jgi:hypothetical protein
VEDLGLDLNEHALNESQRTLKRLGITHVLLPPQDASERILVPSPQIQVARHSESSAKIRTEQPTSSAGRQNVPPLLRSLFHGKHAPIRTLWTYAGLYEDMQQAETPARLGVFKKIQESVCLHLKWSGNDIGSWPLDADPLIFRQGFEYLRPRTVIVFQDNAPKTGSMDAENKALLEQAACQVLILPNLEEMAQGNQQLKNEAWKILQTVPD